MTVTDFWGGSFSWGRWGRENVHIRRARTLLRRLPWPVRRRLLAAPKLIASHVEKVRAWLEPQAPFADQCLEGLDALAAAKTALHRPLAATALFSLVLNLLTLTIPLYSLQVYDRVLTSYSAETLAMVTGIALGLLALLVAIDNIRAQLIGRTALKGEQVLAPALLRAAVKDQLTGRPDAILPLRDLTALRSFATSPVMTSLFDAPLAPLYVLVIFLIHPLLGLLALAGMLTMGGCAYFNQKATAKRVERATKGSNSLLLSADQQTRNAEVVDAMGIMPALTRRFRATQDHLLKEQLSATEAGGTYQMASRYMRLALQVLTLGLAAGLVLGGTITPGQMFAASIILSRGLQPVEIAVGSWRNLLSAKGSYLRIYGALERAGLVREGMPLPPPKGEVELEGVYVVAGRERRQILKGVSFTLPAGSSLGIIGPAASGKSTLARVILGVLTPVSGKVRLDGADVTQWPRAALGPHLGYLPQEVELFPGTVAENIARMQVPDPQAVIAAAQWAGVHEMVLKLPQGYDTRIMAGALMLSPGQRQRIALARAFYGEPKLVVLDEPNSNLDGDGEAALANALKLARERGVTVIVIVHRFGVLSQTGTVMLLRDGVVQAMGPREEILTRLVQRAGQAHAGTVVPMLNVVPRPGGAA